jgi:type I restriction enzyme S subunit
MNTTESTGTLEPTGTRPRYDEYEDSSVEWLGEIPSHWEMAKLKYCVQSLVSGGTPASTDDEYWASDGEEGVPWVAVGDMSETSQVDTTEKRVTKEGIEEADLETLSEGTLLYSIYASLGEVSVLGISATTNQAILGITPDEETVSSNFLYYWLQHMQKHVEVLSSSNTQDNLSAGRVRNMPVYLPESREQRAIATYLDRETERIDALIEKKEKLIDLLEEKRTALISHVVTKGLDEDVEMRDSGVEWLGEIPSHWEIVRLKHLAAGVGKGVQMGPYGSMLTGLESQNTGYKVYGQQNTISGDFEVGNRWIAEDRFQEMSDRYELRPGDVVLSRKGSIGNSRIFPTGAQEGIMDSDTIRLRLRWESIDRRFLQWLLHEAWYMQTQIALVKRGAVLSGLNTNTIENLTLALPPIDEQTRLVEHLNEETGELSQTILKVQKGIDQLREYRTALISAAVTGQINVRKEIDTSPTAA